LVTYSNSKRGHNPEDCDLNLTFDDTKEAEMRNRDINKFLKIKLESKRCTDVGVRPTFQTEVAVGTDCSDDITKVSEEVN
jgi:hypothetical protein